MAKFTDQLDRWTVTALMNAEPRGGLVSVMAKRAYLTCSEVDATRAENIKRHCHLAEACVEDFQQDCEERTDARDFELLNTLLQNKSIGGIDSQFKAPAHDVCSAIVYWKLADAMDAQAYPAVANESLAIAFDFAVLGAMLKHEASTLVLETAETTMDQLLESSAYSGAVREGRWENIDQVIAYARELAGKRNWHSVKSATKIIYPDVKAKFPNVKFKFGPAAVGRWIADMVTTPRKPKLGSKNNL